jgi:hypothetical protein
MRRRSYLILAATAVLVVTGATGLVAYDRTEGRRDAAEFLQLDCGSPEWVSVTNELDEIERSPYATEEEALLAQWERLFPNELPEGTGVVSTEGQDGFLSTVVEDDRAEFVLVLDRAVRARATVASVEAGGYVVEGLTKC